MTVFLTVLFDKKFFKIKNTAHLTNSIKNILFKLNLLKNIPKAPRKNLLVALSGTKMAIASFLLKKKNFFYILEKFIFLYDLH